MYERIGSGECYDDRFSRILHLRTAENDEGSYTYIDAARRYKSFCNYYSLLLFLLSFIRQFVHYLRLEHIGFYYNGP